MIKSLSINNYALIQSLEMSPSPHLNIITGETGAGKSIMLGAVGLLLGKRADTKALFSESDKCIIEGTFDVKEYDLKSVFQEADLDYDEECIIRREISPSGKSRAFVNDTPVTLDVLKKVGFKLMDIHSQHESLELGNNSYQEEILDLFGGHQVLKEDYQKAYLEWKKAQKQHETLVNQSKENAQDLDYKQFLLNELEHANIKSGELKNLEEELEVLENAEEITINLGQLHQALSESEFSVVSQLQSALPMLSEIRKFSKPLDNLYERLNSASIELDDIASEISKEQDAVELDPEKLQLVKDRVDLIQRLQQKHLVTDSDELIEIQQRLNQEMEEVLNIDDEIKKAASRLAESEHKLQTTGQKLTQARKKQTKSFAKAIEDLVHKLGIENASIVIEIDPAKPSATGMDTVEMLFSANKGVTPREIKHVASGGEFSRLIFVIKYLLADKTALPTIIFDEIDTGVSGEVALQMVAMMKQMSKNHQVISISHLPQFAAGGDAHYFVYKDHSAAKSVSRIKKLNNDERIMAIAKMIGGESPGESAIASAKELLGSK